MVADNDTFKLNGQITPLVRRKRNPLLLNYELSYERKLALSNEVLNQLADRVLREVWHPLEQQAENGRIITNLKGRDGGEKTAEGNPCYELMFIQGHIAVNPEDEQDAWQPFSIRCMSEFHDFGERNSIRHKVTVSVHGPVSDGVPMHLLLQVSPCQVEILRIGIEGFHISWVSALLGATPVVTEWIYLEANVAEGRLEIGGDALKSKDAVPFANSQVFADLDKAMKSSVRFSPREELQRN